MTVSMRVAMRKTAFTTGRAHAAHRFTVANGAPMR
jgi:hypothetical protein